MDFIRPAFFVLKEFYSNPEKNLRYILAHTLDDNPFVDTQGVTRTAYGVVRKDRMLEYVLAQVSRRTVEEIDNDALILLKMGIYLLFFSRSYPEYSVVNEIVGVAPGRAKNFINANLRTAVREKEKLSAAIDGIEDPGIRFSMSEFMIENLESLTPDLVQTLGYLNQEPRFHLRVNIKDFRYEDIQAMLLKYMAEFRDLPAFQGFEVKSFGRGAQSMYKKKHVYVQNTSSQIVAIIAARYAGEKVLDACAAPGTKTVTLSMLRPDLNIVANDINPRRIETLREFVDFFGVPGVLPVVSDICSGAVQGKFDLIMADLPCTSAGTMRKNPDLKLKITPWQVEKSAANQLAIVRALLPALAPGGFLVYSVCSFLQAEGDAVLQAARDTAAFSAVDISAILDEFGFKYKKGDWGCYLLPNPKLNNDLFYISLVKHASECE